MIFDGFESYSTAGFRPKVVVIGSGPAGVTVARKLGAAGIPVTILEAGGFDYRDESQELYKGTTIGDPYFDLDVTRLRFRHTHYDTTSAERDPNVVFPLDRLHEAVARGRVGSSSPVHIGLMGFNPDPVPIVEETAPAVADVLEDAQADVVVLVPG